jgi:hypothetical protein
LLFYPNNLIYLFIHFSILLVLEVCVVAQLATIVQLPSGGLSQPDAGTPALRSAFADAQDAAVMGRRGHWLSKDSAALAVSAPHASITSPSVAPFLPL